MPGMILTRKEWGAAEPKPGLTVWPAGEPTGHTVHWEGAGGQLDHAGCAAEVRAIQQYHFSQGYVDIAYNWLVCNHGVAFQGRPENTYESAAQKDGNKHRIAICYMAGPRFIFSPAAQLMVWRLIKQKPTKDLPIGHRDEPSCVTSCPGNEIEAWVKTYTAFDAAHSQSVPTPQPSPAPKPLPPTGVHHPILVQGNIGPAVGELQRKLNAVAGQGLTVDYNFGPKTEQAVKNFQTFFKLVVDGIVGNQTWGVLDYICALKGIH